MNVFEHQSAWRGLEKYIPELLKDINPIKLIVEVGVDHGYSLFTFATLYPNAEVIGVDNFSYADGDHARMWIRGHQSVYSNVRLYEGDSEAMSAKVNKAIDVLHIDADHQYSSIKHDFELWEPKVRSGGAIMMHDVISFPNDVGKFFNELQGDKQLVKNHAGLGVWYKP